MIALDRNLSLSCFNRVHGSQACRSPAAPIPSACARALRAHTPRDPGIQDRHPFRQWCSCFQRPSCCWLFLARCIDDDAVVPLVRENLSRIGFSVAGYIDDAAVPLVCEETLVSLLLIWAVTAVATVPGRSRRSAPFKSPLSVASDVDYGGAVPPVSLSVSPSSNHPLEHE